jgi:hypothetical protein
VTDGTGKWMDESTKKETDGRAEVHEKVLQQSAHKFTTNLLLLLNLFDCLGPCF